MFKRNRFISRICGTLDFAIGFMICTLAVFVLLLPGGTAIGRYNEVAAASAPMEYEDILRFHIRANSGSAADQSLKLKVRDDVLEYLGILLKDCHTFSESSNVVEEQLPGIYAVAVDSVRRFGYDYPVKTYIVREFFPIKHYGDTILPCGKYTALRIDIGEAGGHNWWCMLYPKLCMVDESYAVLDEADGQIDAKADDKSDSKTGIEAEAVKEPEKTSEKPVFRFRIFTFLNKDKDLPDDVAANTGGK